MPQQTRGEEGRGVGLGGVTKQSSVALAVNDDVTVPFDVKLSAFAEDANPKTAAIKVAKISLFITSSLIIRAIPMIEATPEKRLEVDQETLICSLSICEIRAVIRSVFWRNYFRHLEKQDFWGIGK
jgi:hypothetical protein